MMTAKELNLNNLVISVIREEDTQQSDISTKRGPYSQTYSATDRVDLNGPSTVHSYSEVYESATRESIDETQEKKGTIYTIFYIHTISIFANMR